MRSEPSRPAAGSKNDFQAALDQRDVVGTWEWDIVNDEARVDALVAELFGVDSEAVSEGAKLAAFTAGIHADDRERVERLIEQSATEGGAYAAEYRVRSTDHVERRVLAKGRFHLDGAGLPLRARGIIVDITPAQSDDPRAPDGSRAAPVRDGALDRLAEYCIGAHREAQRLGNTWLQALIAAALLEAGHEIARTMLPETGRRLH